MPDLPKRVFLGWNSPVLQKSEEFLWETYASELTWDMRDLLIILPSSLAKRRLRERLALRAEAEKRILYPPKIETVGDLPEHLYNAKFPFASDFVQILAWCAAIRSLDPNRLRGVLPLPNSPAGENWLDLGKMLAGLHRELASDRLNFSDVVKTLGEHPESERWETLANIQQQYLATLDSLKLWDIQTARVVALNYCEPKTTQRIIVIGAVDLNRTQRGFLEQVAGQVEVWIAAPESLADLFDPFGCLRSEAWDDYQIDVSDESLRIAGSPQDQAKLVATCLAELGPRYHTGDVTLGIPDASLISTLRQHLATCGVGTRNGPGVPLSSTEPAQLLHRIGEFLRSRTYIDFAALVRHPIVANVLASHCERLPADWLGQLDAYYHQALPSQLDGWFNRDSHEAHVAAAVISAVKNWLKELMVPERPLSDWLEPLLEVLRDAYNNELCDLNDDTQQSLYGACQAVCSRLAELGELPAALQISLTAWEAIDWLLRSMSGMLVPEPVNPLAIEMLGWLELALDDTPILILTGLHDGVVPESVNADMFLPNQLRRQLGMMDNARRYARDAFALEVMLNSRKLVRIVVGKSGAEGEPLVPSRLLLACGLKRLPSRVLRLVSEDSSDQPSEVVKHWRSVRGASRIDIPQPNGIDEVLSSISVTAFRTYLHCPYRFYLRHVLRLQSEHDLEGELDAAGFGNLLHGALASLLDCEAGQSSDPDVVRKHLVFELRKIAASQFGPHPPAAVEIQLEQAEERLVAFAEKQAAHAAQGWIIRYVEIGFDAQRAIRIGRGRESLNLVGRIDRIDFHPRDRKWAIWDYKTSDTARKPAVAHYNRQQGWIDLQLPLYRNLFRSLVSNIEYPGEPSLGYISLPKKAEDCEFAVAGFSSAELADADQKAETVVCSVLARRFWPPTAEPTHFDDFARVCQTQVQRTLADRPSSITSPRRAIEYPQVSSAVVAAATKIIAAASKHTRPAPPLVPQLIRASAGTGKTFQLSNRLLQIILAGQEIDSILATTFTRKAAGEIMHRVLQRLARACVDSNALNELAAHLTQVEVTHATCLAALRRLTKNLHRLRISTLDSFFAQVARTFGLEMELSPTWSVIEPVQERSLRMQAIQRVLDNCDRTTLVSLVKMLNKGESQRRVADQIADTVEAGYETFRITDRSAWSSLRVPHPPTESQMESVIQILTALDLHHDSVRKEMRKLADLVSVGLWERAAEHGLVSALVSPQRTYYKRELPDELCSALMIMLRRCAAELLPVRRAQTEASYDLLKAFDAEYLSLLRRQRALTFADVTHFLASWLDDIDRRENSTDSAAAPWREHARLNWRLDCGVSHLLLDEFQDTSPSQWRIIKSLACPLGGKPSPDKSFFCVGDTKQAIYGWRGGVSEIFDAVSASIAELREEQLNRSFRSSPMVMDAVNRVFKNLSRHTAYGGSDSVAREWSSNFPDHATTKTDLPGYVLLQNLPKFDRDVPKEERKRNEMEFAADLVTELAQNSPNCGIGILFRGNDGVAAMIELLKARGIAASQDGGNPLTDSCAVELLLSLIHLADHPSDTVVQYHVSHSPLLADLCAAGLGDMSLHGADMLAYELRQMISRKGLGRTISSIAEHLQKSLNWWDQHRLEQFVELAHKFESQWTGRLRDFELFVQAERVALPAESQVKVMTIHKSKGLEFDAVFLPDLEVELVGSQPLLVARGEDPCQAPDGVLRYMNAALQRLLPESWQQAFKKWHDRQVTEALCLLYVAMTRARSALYMLTKPRSKEAVQELGSIVQSTLGDGELESEGGVRILELGVPNWFDAVRKPTTHKPQAIQFELPFEQSIALRTSAALAPRRNFRVAAPSGMGQAIEIPAASAFTNTESLGASIGTLIHAFFEQIQWLEEFNINDGHLREVAIHALTPEQLQHLSLDQQITAFRRMLHMESVRQAISQARYHAGRFGITTDHVTVENERPINLVMDDRLIAGTIDRLVVLWHDGRPFAAEIIDYKTDFRSPDIPIETWTHERVEHHRPQLEIYSQVVSKLYQLPLECIESYLVLLSGDRLVRCNPASVPSPHVFSRSPASVL